MAGLSYKKQHNVKNLFDVILMILFHFVWLKMREKIR